MAFPVNPLYQADIYLDTNILEDYLEQTYPLLNQCIDVLTQCPFVRLHASHYVEYELTEVRKLRLFEQMVEPNYEPDRAEQSTIKARWEYKGQHYVNYQNAIKQQVMDEIDNLKDIISFDDNVLHDDLLNPVKELTLSSTISREDSMVLTSAVFPNRGNYIKYCAILSADSQFSSSVKRCKDSIKQTMDSLGTETPVFLYAKQLKTSFFSKSLNLYKGSNSMDVEAFIRNVIFDIICKKNSHNLFAKTSHYAPKDGDTDKYLYLKMHSQAKELQSSDGLIIIPKDLSFYKAVKIDETTYQHHGKIITTPYRWSLCPKFSVTMRDVDDETFNLINTNGCYVFYDNI